MPKQVEQILADGLYDPSFEHDNCGIGAIIDIEGRKSHQLVCDALSIVEHLEHRAGKDAEGKTGDGVGILTQIPHSSKNLRKRASHFPERGATAWVCSSSRREIWRCVRQGPCSRSLPERLD